MTKKHDYIIVGQGIAGTIMDWKMRDWGLSGIVIDGNNESASYASSGLINPLTGRKFVTAWNYDESLRIAKTTYKKLEEKFSEKLFDQRKLYRSLSNIKARKAWDKRTQKADIHKYTKNIAINSNHSHPFDLEATNFINNEVYVLNKQKLINKYRDWLQSMHAYLSEKFDYSKLEIKKDQVQYSEISAPLIIFAEGWGVRNNPFFKDLHYKFSSGKAILGTFPAKYKDIIKTQYFIGPLFNNNHWIGSINAYLDTQEENIEQSHQQLQRFAESISSNGFMLQQKLRGVRVTSEDRLPMVGAHFKHNNIFIINGLSTKGTLYAPYLAECLGNHITKQANLPKEIDCQRFYG